MLEVAIQNASKDNSDVAEAYRVALERRPARVFVHVPSDDVYNCLVRLREAFKDIDKASVIFPAVRKFQGAANSNQELRFFHVDDRTRADAIANLFGTLGLQLSVKDISGTEWARTNAPNSYELWFNGKPMPKICQQPDANGGGLAVTRSRIFHGPRTVPADCGFAGCRSSRRTHRSSRHSRDPGAAGSGCRPAARC